MSALDDASASASALSDGNAQLQRIVASQKETLAGLQGTIEQQDKDLEHLSFLSEQLGMLIDDQVSGYKKSILIRNLSIGILSLISLILGAIIIKGGLS
jgi:hypothetical protein